MTEYANFRERLDAVLRTLDVKQVTEFLIAEKQWSPGMPADPEFAMWMMIAGRPSLSDLHERAYEWLVSHGHEEEAKTFLKRDKKQGYGPKAYKGDQRSSISKGEKHRNKSSKVDQTKQRASRRRGQD